MILWWRGQSGMAACKSRSRMAQPLVVLAEDERNHLRLGSLQTSFRNIGPHRLGASLIFAWRRRERAFCVTGFVCGRQEYLRGERSRHRYLNEDKGVGKSSDHLLATFNPRSGSNVATRRCKPDHDSRACALPVLSFPKDNPSSSPSSSS